MMKFWWVRSDPCGLFSSGLTVALVLYAQFVVVRVLILPWYGFSYHVIGYTICSLLSITAHCKAQFTNPGTVPLDLGEKGSLVVRKKNPEIGDRVPRVCKRCRAVKPYNAHHCSSCERCVIRMDHHCPWVNNCVAAMNQKYFLQFLLYTAFCCIYSGVMLCARFVSCTNNMKQCPITGFNAALCVVNFVEALVFGLFVIIMLFDQFSAIWENTGEDSKDIKGQQRTKYSALKEVFGEPFCWRWFVPFSPTEQMIVEFEEELQHLQLVEVRPVNQKRGDNSYFRQQQLAKQRQMALKEQEESVGATGGEKVGEGELRKRSGASEKAAGAKNANSHGHSHGGAECDHDHEHEEDDDSEGDSSDEDQDE